MSEKAFRIILVVVVLIWGIFVLMPALADFLPRAWTALQYMLPGDNPTILVIVKDTRYGEPIDNARVQIVLEQTTLAAITDKKGEAVFEAVPAGRATAIKVQKMDYELSTIRQPDIPRRQRVRYAFTLTSDSDRRLFIGHETSASTVGVSLLDAASHLSLTPPGTASVWENLQALDMKAHQPAQRLYVLTTDRLIALSTYDGRIVRDVPLQVQTGGMALSPNGDTVYVFGASAPTTQTRWLMAIDTRTFNVRVRFQISMAATRAVLLPSPDGQRLYVAGVGGQSVSVYEIQQIFRLVTFYRTAAPIRDMALARDGRAIYALLDGRTPIYIDVTATSASSTPLLDNATAASFDGATRILVADHQVYRWICVLNPKTDEVIFIDANTKEVFPVSVGREPVAFVATPTASDLIVASKSSNTLSFLSLLDRRIVDTVDVRSKPVLLTLP